ncbi:MAG: PD40 domain-containing protein [Deltaproteobacteria bacterium]|nr:PD40 domain-containing protein [Deltaproteobacteria bacterium]
MAEGTRRAMKRAGVAGLLVLLSCRAEDVELVPPNVDGGSPEIPGLLSLSIRPASVSLVESGQAAAPTQFTAFGAFDDGERELTDQVAWSLAPAELGTITAGRFERSGLGGRGTVTAAAGPVVAQADLEIRLQQLLEGPDLFPGDATLFPSDTSSDSVDQATLELLYPSHEVELPQNLGRLDVEWIASGGLDRFQVVIESPLARIRANLRGTSARLGGATWAQLAGSHLGETVELRVRGLRSNNPTTIYTSDPITITFSAAQIPGAFYYWSTTTRGIMRARIDAPLATLAVPTSGGECVGCHTLSRDGRSVAYTRDNKLRSNNLPDGALLFPSGGAAAQDSTAAAYSPDGARLLVADREHLELVDALTGALLSRVDLPEDRRVAQPDWSPDGRWVAIAYLNSRDEDLREHFTRTVFEGTSLAVLSVGEDGALSSPQVLVQSSGEDDTVFAPSFSPDSSAIAFVRARGRSKDNRRAELYLIRTDGSGGPVSLARLNRRGGGRQTITQVGNSLPVWAPSTRPGEAWLAFSSIRSVGSRSPEGYDQLWIAGIDLSRVVPGDDPSSAAFWLPFQSLTEANHRPLWTPNPNDTCVATVDLCGNGVDDDCSGQADDACCTPSPELCGDQTDNDCDRAVDEGCGCSLTESCANGVDDDCDGRTDRDDDDCED